MEVSATLIDINGKKVICVVTRDITGRKRAEEELAKYRHHFEDLVKERTQAQIIANKKLNKELIEHRRTEKAL